MVKMSETERDEDVRDSVVKMSETGRGEDVRDNVSKRTCFTAAEFQNHAVRFIPMLHVEVSTSMAGRPIKISGKPASLSRRARREASLLDVNNDERTDQ
nr:hypothetical protein BgiMline_015725 [Biomphalaria glabrata]